MFGKTDFAKLRVIQHYKEARFRATGCYFMTTEERKLVGWDKHYRLPL